jgi:hypothetical protein
MMRFPSPLAAALVLCRLVAPAQAGDQPVDYVSIDCDAAHGSLQIAKLRSASASLVPRDRWVRALDDMVGSKSLPGDDGFQFPINDLERACKIGNARYQVRLKAVIFGTHVLGRCGAADPSVEVSVLRNGLSVVDKFLMVDNCGDTGTTGLNVSVLEFLEPAGIMRLNATFEDGKQRLTPLALSFDTKSIKDLALEKVWDDLPMSSDNGVARPTQ